MPSKAPLHITAQHQEGVQLARLQRCKGQWAAGASGAAPPPNLRPGDPPRQAMGGSSGHQVRAQLRVWCHLSFLLAPASPGLPLHNYLPSPRSLPIASSTAPCLPNISPSAHFSHHCRPLATSSPAPMARVALHCLPTPSCLSHRLSWFLECRSDHEMPPDNILQECPSPGNPQRHHNLSPTQHSSLISPIPASHHLAVSTERPTWVLHPDPYFSPPRLCLFWSLCLDALPTLPSESPSSHPLEAFSEP